MSDYEYERKYVESTGITSGFFNSDPEKHDRVYTAEQMSSMFDGLIRDGVFSTIGKCFAVRAHDSGKDMRLVVSTGKAWFNHTWILNDSEVITEPLADAPIIMGRIDAVCIEVNKSEAVRQTQIVVVTGIAGDVPERPVMLHDDTTDQYPLAFINVGKQVTAISDADITNVVGDGENYDTPFVTGILDQVSITELLQQWTQQATDQRVQFSEEFNEWFKNVQYVLDGDVAGHLQTEIDDLWSWINSFGNAEEISY